jgi:hypothetical protein
VLWTHDRYQNQGRVEEYLGVLSNGVVKGFCLKKGLVLL